MSVTSWLVRSGKRARADASASLAVNGLNAFYGYAHVLFDVSLDVAEGQALAVLGRNGAGKSTLFKAVAGVPGVSHSGHVDLGGLDISRMKPDVIARAGLQLVPEDRRVLPSMTVRENLQLAVPTKDRRAVQEAVDSAVEVFPEMADFLYSKGNELSGGQQQMVAIARALVPKPKVVLMDEPSTGLAPVVLVRLREVFETLRARGLTMVVAEQNVNFALAICDRVLVLEKGQVVFRGTRSELRARSDLVERYLEV